MANDGKIYITISDRRFGQNVAEADAQNKIDKEKIEKVDLIGDYAKHQFFNFIKSEAKQAVSYTISNIGNFTGDYEAQQHISDAMQILNFASDLTMGIVAGAKYGGGWGALIGAGIVVTGKAISIGQQYYAGYVQNARQNRDIAQLRTRAGLNSTNNGSRGTEY